MSSEIITLLIIAAVTWHMIIFRLSPKLGLVKLNFNKKPIMASYGIVAFPYMAAIATILAGLGYIEYPALVLYLTVMGAMWLLGIVDDVFGSREVGGFKGHFKKLIFERKLTTGAIKALGGGIVGLCAAVALYGWQDWRWIPASLIIPLASNILNLLDLRPGRAVTVFFLGIGVTCILALGRLQAPWVVGTIAVVTLAFGILDSRGRAMMGDSGSNALGAALGLTIVLSLNTLYQIGAILLFLIIHWYSEKHSITALVERNGLLRNIDRRLGVR